MAEVKKSQAIKDFLNKNTWPDLAALYTDELEVQVNVAQDAGILVSKNYQGRQWREYTDNISTWKPFRIPLHSMTEPEDNDNTIRFDLSQHVEGIGCTGWNWKKRKSCWVAFDFDSIMGHSEKHSKKLSVIELDEIKTKVNNIEWITLRKSTGGKGLHIYVFLDFDETINNHTEHLAVGRSILSQLSVIAGFDFESKVDTNSGNMWLFHRKMNLPTGGRNPDSLLLLKQGCKLKDVPRDWRDYLDVVSGKRKRTIPFFIKGESDPGKALDEFEEMSNQRQKVALDKDHERLLEWIRTKSPGGSWWRDDQWMLVTHTFALKCAHAELGFKGPFDTVAQGENYGQDWNVFGFPAPNGAWAFRRFTKGCEEAPTWEQDGVSYTKCYYNKYPDFKLACKLNNGVEKPNGGYAFTEANKAIATAKMLGTILELPEKMKYRPAILKLHKDKRLIIEVEKVSTDTGMETYDGSGKTWNKIFDTKADTQQSNVDGVNIDRMVRHIIHEGGHDAGWAIYSEGKWNMEPLEHVKLMLNGYFGYKLQETMQILGTATVAPYKLVNRPFDVEYPPGRLWNQKGAKLAFEPAKDLDNLKFPTWQKIMDQVGRTLNPYIAEHPWAKANGVITGADYLILWIAALFQEPFRRSPYLFFYNTQQDVGGKTTFHRAISLLMAGEPPIGYIKINDALKASAQFNAELQHAILCIVEEYELNLNRAEAKITYNKIKELVTANEIGIHEKRQTPCMVKNSTHWIQTANEKAACPIFKNDTRITMIKVEPIDPIDKIGEHQLMQMLKAEGPDFLAHILHLEIPPYNDRLIIPVIETEDKRTIQAANLTLIEQYILEKCHIVDGECIKWSEFFDGFVDWMEPADAERWTKRYTGSNLPDYNPRGRRRIDNEYCIANLSWQPRDPANPIKERLIVKTDKLVPANSINGAAHEITGDSKTAGQKDGAAIKNGT